MVISIDSLPDEMLVNIFTSTASNKPTCLLSLLNVSQRWRTVTEIFIFNVVLQKNFHFSINTGVSYDTCKKYLSSLYRWETKKNAKGAAKLGKYCLQPKFKINQSQIGTTWFETALKHHPSLCLSLYILEKQNYNFLNLNRWLKNDHLDFTLSSSKIIEQIHYISLTPKICQICISPSQALKSIKQLEQIEIYNYSRKESCLIKDYITLNTTLSKILEQIDYANDKAFIVDTLIRHFEVNDRDIINLNEIPLYFSIILKKLAYSLNEALLIEIYPKLKSILEDYYKSSNFIYSLIISENLNHYAKILIRDDKSDIYKFITYSFCIRCQDVNANLWDQLIIATVQFKVKIPHLSRSREVKIDKVQLLDQIPENFKNLKGIIHEWQSSIVQTLAACKKGSYLAQNGTIFIKTAP